MISVELPVSLCSPPLADTLRLMLPSVTTTRLMQAALLEGEPAMEAWSVWRRAVEDPKAFLASDQIGFKRHLPLLYRNLSANRVEVGRDLEPYLRAARAREELRGVRYRRLLGVVLEALRQSEIDFVVGKGVTAAEMVHADPVLRHCHDIDLLIRSSDLPAAGRALGQVGFVPGASSPRGEPRFDHESGLPVELHDRLYRSPFYHGNVDDVWNRAHMATVLGVPVRVMGDADLLVQAPVHASVVPQRYNLNWIFDVVSLLRQRESDRVTIDWARVARIAEESCAQLPLYVMYQYLATTFGVAVPEAFINGLRRSASRSRRLQHLAALDGLRAAPHTRLKLLASVSGWRSRGAIATAMLLPPLEYFKKKQPDARMVTLALRYLARPTWFLGRKFRGNLGRISKRWFVPDPTAMQREFLSRLLPEERLLLGCVRRDLSDNEARRLAHDLHDKVINWTVVLDSASRCGIEPLFLSNVKKCREQGLAVPAHALTRLRVAMFKAMETKERQARQLRDALEFLNRNGLTVMLIKGAALDAVVFPKPWHVVSLDIDLLIRERVDQMPKMVSDRIWEFNGHGNGPFECEFGGHHDLSIDGLLPIDYHELWRDASRVTVRGQEVHVMCPEDMLIATCINACRKRFFQLKSLYGLREILERFPDLDWDRVARKAASYRCRAIVHAALTVANLAVDADVAESSLRKLNVNPLQGAFIRFLATRRSFTPIIGRQVMDEKQYTLWSKRLVSLANLSLILPYAAYTWRQRIARLRWLAQTKRMSKPGLFQPRSVVANLSADVSAIVGAGSTFSEHSQASQHGQLEQTVE